MLSAPGLLWSHAAGLQQVVELLLSCGAFCEQNVALCVGVADVLCSRTEQRRHSARGSLLLRVVLWVLQVCCVPGALYPCLLHMQGV